MTTLTTLREMPATGAAMALDGATATQATEVVLGVVFDPGWYLDVTYVSDAGGDRVQVGCRSAVYDAAAGVPGPTPVPVQPPASVGGIAVTIVDRGEPVHP